MFSFLTNHDIAVGVPCVGEQRWLARSISVSESLVFINLANTTVCLNVLIAVALAV